MDPAPPSRVVEVFDAVCDLPPDAREARLARECAQEPELLAEVRRLLAFDRESVAFLSEAEVEAGRARLDRLLDSAGAPLVDRDVTRIGPYRVLRRLGEGGMGIVYEAEQDSPRRRVALKIVRPQLATPTRVARFRQEVELLGRLQHPGIAQVHDSGTFDLGQGPQPYFVLEMVDGDDLTHHVQRRRLPVSARLELLARICDAVHHAHERGVIHRDLKPENILVDGLGQPRILDFGVARATEGSTVLTTLVTEDGDLLGTIAYMAPEQVRGELDGITPRTDVYALGVIAFELLAQRLPHDVIGLPLPAAMKLVLDHEPPRLSSLRPELAGDVETIVGKALAKEPERRYAGADDLARDLRDHLAHRPIRARPPSVGYRAAKFARRHRALVAGTGATVLALALGLLAALMLAEGENQQRLRAERGLRRAAGQLLTAAQGHLDRGDAWRAAVLHRDVDASQRDWPWQFQARVLPRLLPADQDTSWWLDSRHMLAGDPVLGMHIVDTHLRTSRPTAEGMSFQRLHGPIGCFLAPDDFAVMDWWTGTVARRVSCPPLRSMRALALAVAADGSLIASSVAVPGTHWITCIDDRELWRVETELGAVIFTPDLTRAILYTDGGRLELRELLTGELRGEAHGFVSTTAKRLAFSPDGRSAYGILAGYSGMARLDLEDLSVHPLPTTIPVAYEFALSPDGRRIATAPGGGPLTVCDVQTGEVVRQETVFPDGVPYLHNKPAFSPDGRTLAVAGNDAGTLLVDLEAPPRTAAGLGADDDPRALTYRGHGEHFVYHVAVSPDGHLVASMAPTQAEVHLWDIDSGETLLRLPRAVGPEPGMSERTRLMAFTPDGAELVTDAAGHDGSGDQIVSWDLRSGSVRRESTGLTGDAHRAHAAGRLAERFGAEGGRLGRMAHKPAEQPAWIVFDRATDLRGAGHWRTLLPDESYHAGLAVSPDGRRVAVATERDVTLYALPAGEPLARHYVRTYGMAYSPDGELLALGDRDGRVWLSDAHHDVPLLDFPAHDDYVFSVAWSPAGQRLISASGDGRVRVWDARPESEREADRAHRAARLEALRGRSSDDLRAAWDSADTTGRGDILRVLLERR